MQTTWPILLFTVFILLTPINSYPQSGPCQVKLADLPVAPELMGFQMGMTKDQVKARVPQVVFGPTDDFGVSKTTINPDFDSRINKASFVGVRSVSLDFLDGRLTSLWLGYDGSFKWKTVDEFVTGIASSLKLPSDWKAWRVRGQQLQCNDFAMTVIIVAEGPSFRILDLPAEDLVASRRAAKEEAAESAEETADESVAIMADKRSKTYYLAMCQPAKPIADSDRAVFKSVEEAEKAGFKKAPGCP